jgi:hypothetical protein
MLARSYVRLAAFGAEVFIWNMTQECDVRWYDVMAKSGDWCVLCHGIVALVFPSVSLHCGTASHNKSHVFGTGSIFMGAHGSVAG